MHLLAWTVSGLRVELVVRDHSEKLLHSGSSFAVNAIFTLSRLLVVLQATGDGPVAGIDEFTNNLRGVFYRSAERTRPVIGSCAIERCLSSFWNPIEVTELPLHPAARSSSQTRLVYESADIS